MAREDTYSLVGWPERMVEGFKASGDVCLAMFTLVHGTTAAVSSAPRADAHANTAVFLLCFVCLPPTVRRSAGFLVGLGACLLDVCSPNCVLVRLLDGDFFFRIASSFGSWFRPWFVSVIVFVWLLKRLCACFIA